MRATVYPGEVRGTVPVPSSKSMAHRAVICAALADGVSELYNVSLSNDIRATIDGMRALGAEIHVHENTENINTEDTNAENINGTVFLHIRGVGRDGFSGDNGDNSGENDGVNCSKSAEPLIVDCGESGSTLRFFIPIFALWGNKLGRDVRFVCHGRLAERPQTVYQELFAGIGSELLPTEGGWLLRGGLAAGEYRLRGDISSQFISGLLFALPLLDRDSCLHIAAPFESRSYVLLTLSMLAKFGVRAEWLDENTLFVPGGQRYRATALSVEGDYSQLAFFAVLAAINSELLLTGVDTESLQGDRRIIDIVRDMGASVREVEGGYVVAPGELAGCEIDLADCPDLGPVLCVLAAAVAGRSRLYNAGRLRIKESDRIEDVQTELLRCGVDISSDEDTIYINGIRTCNDKTDDNKTGYPGGVVCSGHNDHRIVMALSVLATICGEPLVIEGAQAINKSYPRFFADLAALGIKVVTEDAD